MQSRQQMMVDGKKSKFIELTQERLTEATQIVDTLNYATPSMDQVNKLIKHFHQMAGAGGLFQLKEFCQHALQAEEVAMSLTKKKNTPGYSGEINQLKMLILKLSATIDNAAMLTSMSGDTPQIEEEPRTPSPPLQTRVLVVGLGRHDKRAFAAPLFDALEKAEFLVDEMEGKDVTPQNLLKIRYDAFVIVCPDPPQAAYELARNIRSQRSSMATVPIILISAGGTFKDKVQAIRGGGDGVFNSSEDPALVINRLKKLLEKSKPKRYRVLIVEDDPVQASGLFSFLDTAGFQPYALTDASQFEEGLLEAQPDILILDVNLGDVTGFELAKFVRQQEKYNTTPIIFLTTENQLQFHVEGAKHGDDYLIKPAPPQLLVATIAGKLERYQTLKDMIGRDGLTGALTHAEFMNTAKRMTENERAGVLYMLMLDIDNFGAINENYGYGTGEKVVNELSNVIKETIRSYGITGRIGGDEFAILVDSLTEYELVQIANLLKEEFERRQFTTPQGPIGATVSGGIAEFQSDMNLNSWFAATREVLATAKERGKSMILKRER
jgi:diguanylate cyclase (GGDEF)-like protein